MVAFVPSEVEVSMLAFALALVESGVMNADEEGVPAATIGDAADDGTRAGNTTWNALPVTINKTLF